MKYLTLPILGLLLAVACAGPGSSDAIDATTARPEVRYYVIADT